MKSNSTQSEGFQSLHVRDAEQDQGLSSQHIQDSLWAIKRRLEGIESALTAGVRLAYSLPEVCKALGISPAFSDPQFAEILGCCPRTVFSLRKSGQLPFFTVGNRPRVRREDLAAFMARRAMPAMPVAAVQEGGRNGK